MTTYDGACGSGRAAAIYDLGNSTGTVRWIGEAEGSGRADVVIAVALLCRPQELADAVALAQRTAPGTICIAIVGTGPFDHQAGVIDALRVAGVFDAFDRTLPVFAAHAADTAARLGRSLLCPVGEIQPIGCDWNDVRTIVNARGAVRLARHARGRGHGAERAGAAATQAGAVLRMLGGEIGRASGMAVRTTVGAANLRGAEIKSVIGALRQDLPDDAWVIQGIDGDDRLPDDALEVDWFVFE